MNKLVVGVDIPPVILEEGNQFLSAKKLGILRAMRNAVEAAEPGTLILQDDIEVDGQYLKDVQVKPGKITVLNERIGRSHICPRAFIVPDEVMKTWLLGVWSNETATSCTLWKPLPKLYGQTIARVKP